MHYVVIKLSNIHAARRLGGACDIQHLIILNIKALFHLNIDLYALVEARGANLTFKNS